MFVPDLICLTPAGSVPFHRGTSDGVIPRFIAGGSRAGIPDHFCPAVDDGHHVEPPAYVGKVQDIRTFRKVQPRH